MRLTKSRVEVSEALNAIEGVKVASAWPKVLTQPMVIYMRTGTMSGEVEGSEEGVLDTIYQYTVYVIEDTLLKAEVTGDKVIEAMENIGYHLAMTHNPSDNQVVMTFMMIVDNKTNISYRRR